MFLYKRYGLHLALNAPALQVVLPRHHLSDDDCLKEKRGKYYNCSVLCGVRELCTMIHTYEQFLGLGEVFARLFLV